MKYLIVLSMLLASMAISEPVKQSHYKQHGDTKIFYSAFDSSFIAPEVAAAYDFVRGKDKGLVNIAVVKTLGQGEPAKISGQVLNIFQQSQQLEFIPIKEQNSTYYLAPFEFENEDFLTFKITVDSQSNQGPYSFKFQKKMYHN
ncbi:MAG: DUF4426 domain-containing protein [Porticoccaceae bacterium]|nr:DUF4426 domain-containing protein [Porticoccaceae bacterium]